MKIDWNRPKGTENFSDAQMAAFYSARAEYVRYLQSSNIKDVPEDEINAKALSVMNVTYN